MPGQTPGQPTFPGQPTPPFGAQAGATATTAMQSLKNNATVQELTAPHVVKTAGASFGIGLGAAAAIALLGAIILSAASSAAFSQAMSSSALSSLLSGELGGVLSGPNFLQILVFTLVSGVSGSFVTSMSANGISLDSLASASLSLPVGLSGVALLIGAAFGAYLFAHKLGVRFKWTGVVSAVVVGVASGLVLILLAAIFPISLSASYGGQGAGASLSGVSFRTFAMAFILSGLGALAGYFLAQFAPDSSNVFLAAWRWMHRARGFVRTVAESVMIYTVVFTVVGLVLLIVVSILGKTAATFMLIPFIFPFLPFAAFAIGSLGAVTVAVTGQQAVNLSVFTPNLGNWTWGCMALVVVFVITTLYIALRAAARNIYDRGYANWRHSWKSPAAAAVIWLLVTLCAASFSAGVSAAQSGSGAVTVSPAMWYFVLAAVWAFLIEVVALTFGPTLVMSMPGMWKLFVGGTVQPTPQSVTDYVAACNTASARPSAPQTPDTGAAMGGGAMPPAAAATAQPGMMPTDAGTAPTTVIPPAFPTAAVQHKPMTAKQKMTLIIVGVVAALAVALGVAYAVLNATVFSPSHVAEDYLSAISSGDYAQANKLADPQIDQSQRALLTDDASKTENATITNARVVSVNDGGDGSKSVSVTYTIGGSTVNDTFTMAPVGNRFLVFPNWTITTPLLKRIDLNVSSAITALKINGVPVTAKNAVSTDGSSMSFAVYPGVYRVSAADSKYISSDTTTLDTHTQTSGDVTAEPTDALTAEIQSSVDDYLKTCAASTDANPDGCPFGLYLFSSDRYRNFSWTIADSPTVTRIDLEDGTFNTDSGEADVTYEYQNYDDTWEGDDRSNSFYISGEFTIDGDKVTVAVDKGY